MNQTPIYLSRPDHAKLTLLLTAATAGRPSATLHKLREELERAVVLDPAALPAELVTLDSAVTFEDLATGEVETYTISLPERANPDARRLSVLAPIGLALIGCRAGDIVNWQTPGGNRQLKVKAVAQPAAGSLGGDIVPAFSGYR